MTSRERFLKTIKGEKTDRMPVTMFIIDQGHFINQLYPAVDPHDYTALQLKVVEAQKQFGADVFVRMLYGINDPIHIHMGGVIVTQQTENWEVTTTETINGTVTVQHSVIKTPDGQLTQDFSINEIRPGTFLYACTKKPILCEKDLDIAIQYEPKMLGDFAQKTKEKVRVIKDAVGEDGIVGAWAPHGPFNNASILIPHEDIYCLFLEDYAYYEKVMNFAMERVLGYTRAMEQSGVDVLCVGGNVPGGFLGKATYDKYILPFEKRYIDFCQANGTPVMYHNCGEIMNLVESYKELGTQIVDPFSPPPLGDTDLEKAIEIINDEYCMVGGVDQINVIQNGTLDDVKRATEKTAKAGRKSKRFILQNADFLEYGTPEENVRQYVKTGIENA